jgi:hypothetical protein
VCRGRRRGRVGVGVGRSRCGGSGRRSGMCGRSRVSVCHELELLQCCRLRKLCMSCSQFSPSPGVAGAGLWS